MEQIVFQIQTCGDEGARQAVVRRNDTGPERGFEKSELFNPPKDQFAITEAEMQGPRARSRSPRSRGPERFFEPAFAVSEPAVAESEPRRLFSSSQTSLEFFFEPAVAVSTVKGEHTAVAETNVKAEPRESPTCPPAVAVPQPSITVYSSDEE